MKRSLVSIFFLLWAGVILSVYYVVQKPSLLFVFPGFLNTLWTLFVASLLLFNGYGIGKTLLYRIGFRSTDVVEHFLFAGGIGLGAIGLLGLIFSALQIARAELLTSTQLLIATIFLLKGNLKNIKGELNSLFTSLNHSFSEVSYLIKIAVLLPFIFSFLLTLVPPIEAFDALLYHLAEPARILQDGGLQIVNNIAFWHPNLNDNIYLWALAMGSDRATQIIHLAWGMFAMLLLWHWATEVWSPQIGQKTLLLVAAIPSLPVLASWAYADMALIYCSIATLYALTKSEATRNSTWLRIAGIMAGLAMGIKYTSFVLPLTCGLLLLFKRPLSKAVASAFQFSLTASLVAFPWYARNTIMMGNPIYPFFWGGRFIDSFISTWISNAGTGIGWNAVQIISLPLNIILGTHDATFFDGRIGAVLLILTPLILLIPLSHTGSNPTQSMSLISIGLFAALGYISWAFGVINTSGLWQARYLFPIVIPFAIPAAIGWSFIYKLDLPKLRISFILNAMIAIVITTTVFDTALFTIRRNPLLVALGSQSQSDYIQQINPSYSAVIEIMDKLPINAYVYSLYEPRTYLFPRKTQNDNLLYNFSHDSYLYQSPPTIVQHWKNEGYTHVLVYEIGLKFVFTDQSSKFEPSERDLLNKTLQFLNLIDTTPDASYSLYQIP